MTTLTTGEAKCLASLLAVGKRNLFSGRGCANRKYHSRCTMAMDGVGPLNINAEADPVTITQPQIRHIVKPLVPVPSLRQQHILSAKQFTRHDLSDLFSLAHEMRLQVERNNALDILKGKVLCTAFYEPSTRTSAPFEAAMKRCGGEIVSITADGSSANKGETLSDTLRTLACYGDAIILRHPEVGSAQLAAEYSPIPIINAGDGIGEHPTQALLDLYAIRSELGTMNGRTITLLGDLKNDRAVHSLVSLLSLYPIRLNFVSPSYLAIPPEVVSAARDAGVPVTTCASLDDVLADTDMLYVAGIQKERFKNEQEWLQVNDICRTDHAVRARKDMVVLHSSPCVNGTGPEDLRRAAHSHQTSYGLFVRMALLASVIV